MVYGVGCVGACEQYIHSIVPTSSFFIPCFTGFLSSFVSVVGIITNTVLVGSIESGFGIIRNKLSMNIVTIKGGGSVNFCVIIRIRINEVSIHFIVCINASINAGFRVNDDVRSNRSAGVNVAISVKVSEAINPSTVLSILCLQFLQQPFKLLSKKHKWLWPLLLWLL